MSLEEPKATIHFAGNDLFVGITPSRHALTLDTDHERASAPTPMELLLVALGAARLSMSWAFCKRNGSMLRTTELKSMESAATTTREAFQGLRYITSSQAEIFPRNP